MKKIERIITFSAVRVVYCQICDTFAFLLCYMVTTNDILNFAFKRKVFTRKALIANLKSEDHIGSPGTFSEQLNRLLKTGQLVRVERGVYKLADDARNDFWVECTEEIRQINQQLNAQFPFMDYCLWSASTLIPYMHHIPNLNLVFVDVEREVTESVFNLLNAGINKRVFLQPSLTDMERYISTNDAIIIRPLISESPLQLVDGINTPTIEKVLVDIVGDVEFLFLQGSEINYVYTTIFERHNVNKNRLLRYAARRGRKEEVEKLINANKL
ncbi:MAG: type IV toxin-antitoxin system AbiEi family antitoxin domain-containing protein [Bacteroidales bacterium]|nr:type IV toxin-antitoxin system AbiEi family antitoxin domain-containing protein [Bacteroidales bacterium]